MTYQDNPQDRLVGEPLLWYYRFLDYYIPQGSERTIEQAFRLWLADQDQAKVRENQQAGKASKRRPSIHWYNASKKYEWKRRAEAYDQALRAEKLAAEEAEKSDWQNKRRQLMTAFFARLAQALQTADFSEITPSQLTQATRMILDQNRLEYGLPTIIGLIDQVIELEWSEVNEG